MRKLHVDHFRVKGEVDALIFSVLGLIVVCIMLFSLTFGLVFLGLFIGLISIKVQQGRLLGCAVKVTSRQFPEIYSAVIQSASELQVKVPDVFITQSPELNAFAMGSIGRKSIVLTTALVEALALDELTAIIGHEMTHIKANHTSWIILSGGAELIQIPIVSYLLGFIFLFWSRKAEYTADRGALLSVKEPRTVIAAFAKLAVGKELYESLDVNGLFYNQQQAMKRDRLSQFSEALSTHPHLINRVHKLIEFYESDLYRQIALNSCVA